MLSIQTNVNALEAAMNVTSTNNQLSNTIGQLSSGYRIDTAAVDPAATGISEQLQADISSYTQANQNAVDGQSVVNTAASALGQVSNILTSMRTLAMEAANSDVSGSATADANVTTEFNQLQAELTRIGNNSTYDGTALFTGTTSVPPATFQFQVGIGATAANDAITVNTTAMKVSDTGLKVDAGSIKVDNAADAEAALTNIDAAIGTISTYQATLGSASDQLGDAISTIAAAGQSLSAANSGLADVNVATASAAFAQQTTLEQAGVAVLAQANQLPSLAVKLLG